MDTNEWGQQTPEPGSEITITQMTEYIRAMMEARKDYEDAKDQATKAHDWYEHTRKTVLNALTTQGLDKFEAPGLALVYKSTKEVYRTPKTNEDKQKLFDYIKQKYGEDTLITMASINHQTLNSWANKETETGDVMEIPGLDQPTVEETINVRRK
jgi:hypothetical protein